MFNRPTTTQAALLALSLLAACAAGDPADVPGPASRPIIGASGKLLVAQFALTRTDLDTAATEFLAALGAEPHNSDLQQQAFTATLLAGRPEALGLAQQLPTNPVAILVLGDADAKAGDWASAERRFAMLPSSGVTQVLRPLVLAWAQQGAGNTDDALATLRPFLDGQRYRGVFALHAAMINDLAGRKSEAARLYRQAALEYGSLNLRLGTIIASWQSLSGQEAEARATIRAMVQASPDLSIAESALQQAAAQREVLTPANGLAEAYLALAATVQAQGGADFSLLLLRLALDLQPNFTSARLLAGEIEASSGRFKAASAALAPVPDNDPLIALVQLRQAQYADRGGDSAGARALLEQLADRYKQRPEPLTLLGDMQRLSDHYAEAAETYGRAIDRVRQPTQVDWPLFYDQGVAYDRAHDWPHAEADLLRALELSPDQPSVLNYLGYAWTEQGRNIVRARQMIERAVEQRPNDGSIVDSLGWVLLQQGDKASAVRILERAVELQSEDSTINGHLGDAYMAAGRHGEALILNPDPQEAAALNARLAGVAMPASQPNASAEHHVE
jgi:tetratricopeptide (TPR) repeat protein